VGVVNGTEPAGGEASRPESAAAILERLAAVEVITRLWAALRHDHGGAQAEEPSRNRDGRRALIRPRRRRPAGTAFPEAGWAGSS